MSTTTHDESWDHLAEIVTEVMKQTGVPDVSVGILHKGEIAAAGFGETNVEHLLPVTDETLFQIGSITKTFTGTTMMRLVEARQADLDATVRTYLPHFKVSDEAAASPWKIHPRLHLRPRPLWVCVRKTVCSYWTGR